MQRPTTIYGVTKVAGELLCDYYASRFGIDTRGLRLPGLISYVAAPGGGTTDYAVEMFYHAIRYGRYTCFLSADTRLDMAYMPDAISGMIGLMAADAHAPALPQRLQHHGDERDAGGYRRRHPPATSRSSRSTTMSIRCASRSPTVGRARSTTVPRMPIGIGNRASISRQ